MKIYFDGSCTGTLPSNQEIETLSAAKLAKRLKNVKMRCCIVAIHKNKAFIADVQIPVEKVDLVNSVTSEWYALFYAMRYARSHGIKDVEIFGDCKGVIQHLLGNTLSNNDYMKDMTSRFYRLLDTMHCVNIEYINRKENIAGIYMETGMGSQFKWKFNAEHKASNITILSYKEWQELITLETNTCLEFMQPIMENNLVLNCVKTTHNLK